MAVEQMGKYCCSFWISFEFCQH